MSEQRGRGGNEGRTEDSEPSPAAPADTGVPPDRAVELMLRNVLRGSHVVLGALLSVE